MSLPTPNDLFTMNYTYKLEPFVAVPAKSYQELNKMNFTYDLEPFVTNELVWIPSVVIILKETEV